LLLPLIPLNPDHSLEWTSLQSVDWENMKKTLEI